MAGVLKKRENLDIQGRPQRHACTERQQEGGRLQAKERRLRRNMSCWHLFFFFLTVVGLCCCARGLSNCGKWVLPSSCSAGASHCGGFSCCRAQALECGLSSCGAQA